MQIAYGLLTAQRHPDDPRSHADLYTEAISLAVQAEALGLDSVWTSEHHFVDDGYIPSQLILLGAIGARTERIGLGAGVVLAPLHNPLRLAEDAATVDLISRGRLLLGLGLGWRPEEFEGLGIPMGERAKRLEGVVAVLRQAWSSRPTTGDGRFYNYPGLNVTPRPYRAGGVPLWLGGEVDAAVRRAGRVADGHLMTLVTPEEFARRKAMALEAAAGAGRASASLRFGVHWMVFASNASDPWMQIRDIAWYRMWKYRDIGEARGSRRPRRPPHPSKADYRALRSRMIVGSPAEVAHQIREFSEPLGREGLFLCGSYFPGLDPREQAESLTTLGTEVLPLVRESSRDQPASVLLRA